MPTTASMQRATSPSAGTAEPRAAVLGREEFALELAASARLLETLAAGILGDRQLAEDTLQEAALAALDRLDSFEPGTNFHAWMARIVRFVALNQARKRRRRAEAGAEALAQTPAPAAAVPDGVLSELDPALQSALARLRPKARACLLLKTVHGLDYAVIARLLGIPEGTAMSHVHRARAFLRARLAGTELAQGTGRP